MLPFSLTLSLLDRDPRFLDHLAPGGVLARHVLRELLGGRGRRFFALLEDRGVGVGIAQGFHYFAIQPEDDVLRQLYGAHERIPVRRLVSRVALLGDRGYFVHGRRAP